MLNCIRDGLITDEYLKVLNESCGKGVSRKLIEELINAMEALNSAQSKDASKCKDNKRICDKMETKVENWFLDSRCGYYDSNSSTLVPVTSKSPVVQTELDNRELLNDVDGNLTILETMKSKFIVGVENVEMNKFSELFEGCTADLRKKQAVFTVYAIDTFYDFHSGWDNHIEPEKAREAADLIEQGVYNQQSEFTIKQYYIPLRPDSTDEKKFSMHRRWNSSFSTPRFAKLSLYVGQTVIFTSNGINKLIANNSQGVIEQIIVDEATKQVTALMIKPACKAGLHQPSVKVVRDRCIFGYESMKGNSNNSIAYHFGLREQFPIKPACWANAYAIQGLTFHDLILIYNNIRARKEICGYLSVLISRLQNLMDFIPLRKIVSEDICADEDALAFDLYHRKQPYEENKQYHLHKVNYGREFNFNRHILIPEIRRYWLGTSE